MSDPVERYTKVTRQSWFSRLAGAIKGVLFGVVLILAATVLLFWNEGRTVRRARALSQGAGIVVSVAADRVDPAHEDALVHLSGIATTDEMLRDEEFGVAVNAIHLRRTVEMYQWREVTERETDTKVGGGTETTTTYTYEPTWSSTLIDSTSFEQPQGHTNPSAMRYEGRSVTANNVTLGAFSLHPSLVSSIHASEPLTVDAMHALPGDLRWRAIPHDGGVYVGVNPSNPEIGDLRVRFEVVRPGPVSAVAGQQGSRLVPFDVRDGTIALLTAGTVDAASMFESAESANRFMSWILRLVGFVLMTIGVKTVLRPLSVTADVLPPIGRAVQSISGFFSFFIALAMASSTVAVAWLWYRPLIGLTILSVAVAALVLVVVGLRKAMRSEPSRQPDS